MGKRKRPVIDSDSEDSLDHQNINLRGLHSDEESTAQKTTRQPAAITNSSPTKGAGSLLAALNLVQEVDQVTSTSSSPTKPAASPRKKKTNQKPIPIAKPESEWRASDVPRGLDVTKGNAQKLFHVTARDIDASGIQFRTEKRSRGLAGIMHLYQMRDVERVAWAKHGSPEGYDTYIQNQRELWLSRGKDPLKFISVPRPFRYERAGRCKQCQTSFAMPTQMIIDKCEPCRGILCRPSVLVLFDPEVNREAADEEDSEAESETED
ncbi:hypothetical protein PIIN_08534 [Serendipita indica DSM 11827]|uniref:Uncharacterized protein n=1 Tax=Serendipita indica (strain DSM 11827) TaxID=1109443 RepID=G4TTD9_SERID|nr:hypothetical protein PIIN_08534 [Serendipita indica DSM 11827]